MKVHMSVARLEIEGKAGTTEIDEIALIGDPEIQLLSNHMQPHAISGTIFTKLHQPRVTGLRLLQKFNAFFIS